MKVAKYIKILRILCILFLIGLTALMLIPLRTNPSDMVIIGFSSDYLAHFLLYLPWIFVGKILFNNKKIRLWLLLGMLVVVLLEYLQFLLPYRSFNINDLIAGVLGVFASYLLYLIFKLIVNYLKRKRI